jgi:hypothetical protein
VRLNAKTQGPADEGAAPRGGGKSRGDDAAPARMPWWKVAFLALLPLVALLLLLEGALWVAGLGDPDERLSLTRGFSEKARYLLPDRRHPGGWVTQISDGSYPERTIPPKGERLRVLLFGGSNTQGFPTAYIAEQLNRAAPEPGFEVINLGRAGYGSERVLILLRQAMELDPDVLFIYCGHNEFVEAGFALELVRLWKQPWITRAVDRLSRLRTLNVAASLLEAAREQPLAADTPSGMDGAGAAPRPEERQGRGEEFQQLDYEDTLRFYEIYRLNLQSMLRIAEEHEVPVMLCTVVGNMLFPPVVPGLPDGPQADATTELRQALATAYQKIPERLRLGLIQTSGADPVMQLDPRDWGEALDTPARPRRRAIRAAAGDLREPPALRALAAPFDGPPFWTDPALWSARPMELLPTVAALHERRLEPQERLDLEEAVRLLEELRSEFPQQSLVHYALGIVTCALGEDERAVEHLRDAARYDRAPTRGNDVTNGIVRELAREHPDVLLVDSEALVRAACPSGLIGYELMMDNCHLHPDVLPRLMDFFVPGLAELGARRMKGRTMTAEGTAAGR